MLEKLPLVDTAKQIDKPISDFLKKHKKFRVCVVLILIMLTLLSILLFCRAQWASGSASIAQTDKLKRETTSPIPSKTENSAKKTKTETLGAEVCYSQDWKKFDMTYWQGESWFSVANDVWTLPSPNPQEQEKDAVLFYESSCIGGSVVEYKITPRLEEYININVYQKGQLRWEVGGSDKRSVRLRKNTLGCSNGEIKRAQRIELPNEYLPNHDEILINYPLIIHSAIFYLPNGLIRSEIWITYASKNNNGAIITTPRNEYFYDFEPGSVCDQYHFPDINKESYQTGIGLQSQKINNQNHNKGSLLPRVTFNEFRIRPFTSSD